MGDPEAIVHVHGGRSLLEGLAAAGIAKTAAETLEWCDPVCVGPAPAGLSAYAWYRVRSAYLAAGGGPGRLPRDRRPAGGPEDVQAVEARLREQDRALRAIPAATEVVVWAGPELFCQTILMRILVLLAEEPGGRRITLVDPGDQPGSPGCSFGKASPETLRAMFAARRPADGAALDLAERAWAAFTAPDAEALVTLVEGDTSALPHLGAALARHLEDLPDGATGLSTTETRLLQALEGGALARGALLSAIAAREARPFLTDLMLEEILSRLGGGPEPLVAVGADQVKLTARAQDVLAGHTFWEAERWHGGIFIDPEEDDDDDDDDGEEAEDDEEDAPPRPS